jgi:cell division protein FtsI/penicillin-binding protein 2
MQSIDRRIGLLFGVFLVTLALGGLRAGYLGIVRADTLEKAAATQQRQTIEVPARRGTITDIHGVELAVSEHAMAITATPYLVRDPQRVAAKLADILLADRAELLEQLTRRDTGFVYLARRVPPGRAERVEKLALEGIALIPEFRRSYPREWMAAQLLGSVGSDQQGLAGLEYAHDQALKGRAGKRRLVKDALGDPIELRDRERARPGATVRLTIDANIQDRAEAVLAEVGEQWKPKGSTAVVMDPRDGSILALANWPRVNASAPVDEAPEYARMNRAVGATYEPGSTFKAFTVAGALEQDKVHPETEFQLPPTLTVADREIKESHPRPAMTMTVAQILAQSSNVGSVLIGMRLGETAFDKWVRRFGFGKPTGVDLPGEERGIVLDRKDYSGSSIGNLPIGQGIAVTPMQMATAYAAIANGGILRPPHVVASIGGHTKPVPRGKRVITRKTSIAVSRMLEGVVGPGGTATGADIPGYLLAGKTGTAQKADPVNGGYLADKYVASFVGFAPARNPQLLVAVMVDEPRGEIYGGLIAAPAFRKITSFALNYLRIRPR